MTAYGSDIRHVGAIARHRSASLASDCIALLPSHAVEPAAHGFDLEPPVPQYTQASPDFLPRESDGQVCRVPVWAGVPDFE